MEWNKLNAKIFIRIWSQAVTARERARCGRVKELKLSSHGDLS